MASYYDDNFGFWEDMDDPDVREFARQVAKESVRKKCKGCRRWVRLRPDYAYCDSCATRRERGEDI